MIFSSSSSLSSSDLIDARIRRRTIRPASEHSKALSASCLLLRSLSDSIEGVLLRVVPVLYAGTRHIDENSGADRSQGQSHVCIQQSLEGREHTGNSEVYGKPVESLSRAFARPSHQSLSIHSSLCLPHAHNLHLH